MFAEETKKNFNVFVPCATSLIGQFKIHELNTDKSDWHICSEIVPSSIHCSSYFKLVGARRLVEGRNKLERREFFI